MKDPCSSVFIRGFKFLAVAAMLGGCGYHIHGTQPTLPGDVRTLGVGAIENKSLEHGLEKQLAFAFEREVFVRRHYTLAKSPGSADALLAGTIREVSRRPVAFDEDDQAVLYEVRIRLDLTLTRQRDLKVLWSVRDMRELDEYATSGNVIVTSSSEFQQGTLDAKDLQIGNNDPDEAEQISSIQLAEAERKRAMERLLQRAVRDVYDRMIEGF